MKFFTIIGNPDAIVVKRLGFGAFKS